MGDYAAKQVKQVRPKFLYHRKGSTRYVGITGRVWFEGFDTPVGYRFLCDKNSEQFGDMEVYERVSE